MLELALPAALFLLPLPALVYWLAADFRDRGESVRAPFFSRLVALTGETPQAGAVVLLKRAGQRAIVAICWLLIVLALAKPVWVGDAVVRETSARDMLLAVDLSGSMEATDFVNSGGQNISRLDAAKEVLGDFIERRSGDRIGLSVFGNAAFPQATFSDDHDVILELLDELQVRMAGPRTMIGDALGLAVRLFEASDVDNKVVVMLTDGNDTGSKMPVARAAEIAADNGIVVHTIAMGDPTTVGEDALDIDALKEISATTGGRFFVALDRSELDQVYAELDQIEPRLVETVSYRPKISLFHWPLAIAAVLMCLFSLLMSLRLRVSHA